MKTSYKPNKYYTPHPRPKPDIETTRKKNRERSSRSYYKNREKILDRQVKQRYCPLCGDEIHKRSFKQKCEKCRQLCKAIALENKRKYEALRCRYDTNRKNQIKAARSKVISEMPDHYIKHTFFRGLPVTPELIDAKRIHIKILRLCKQKYTPTPTLETSKI